MTYNMNDFPASMAGLDHLVRAKTVELANASADDQTLNHEDPLDRENILLNSKTKADEWFENASEEDKEALRKRFPDDVEIKD